DIIISGAELPALLPENSDVDLTVNIDRSEKITVSAYFPYLDFSYEASVERTISSIETNWLANEIRKAKGSIEELKEEEHDSETIQRIENEILELEQRFENNRNEEDNKQDVLANIRKSLQSIDSLRDEWSKLETNLQEQ